MREGVCENRVVTENKKIIDIERILIMCIKAGQSKN
jgi:hypothetical protein